MLDRGEVANSWRSERWDSFRLLTPNWETRLPGILFDTRDLHGFVTARQVVGCLDTYASEILAPVHTNTTVLRVTAARGGYRVFTDAGVWDCRTLVVASGPANAPNIPAFAGEVPARIDTVTPISYRSPDRLAEGGVLVVGSSAGGLQLAEEIHRSGRAVTIAVGEHVRLPRTYRGKDIFWWMEATGVLDRKGRIRHDGGVVRDAPGMYLLGGNLLRTRRSSYIAGAGPDSEEIASHLHGYMTGQLGPRRALAG